MGWVDGRILDQRLVQGRVFNLSPGLVEVELDGNEFGAKRVRVTEGEFPEGVRHGQHVQVFLHGHSKKVWLGRLDWADDKLNPWWQAELLPGEEVVAIVESFPTYKIATLQTERGGMQCSLKLKELPGAPKRIDDVLHIGDHVAAIVKSCDTERLEWVLSVEDFVNKKLSEEEAYFGIIPSSIKKDLCLKDKAVLVVEGKDITRDFIKEGKDTVGTQLKRALPLWGAKVIAVANSAGVINALDSNIITHVVFDPRTQDRSLLNAFQAEMSTFKGDVLLLAQAQVSEGKNWQFMVGLHSIVTLIEWMKTGQISQIVKAGEMRGKAMWKSPRGMENTVVEQADDYLERLCKICGCNAAVWCKKEPEGVYTIRARHGVNNEKLATLKERLRYSIAEDVLKTKAILFLTESRSASLLELVDKAKHVAAYPLAAGHKQNQIEYLLPWNYTPQKQPV